MRKTYVDIELADGTVHEGIRILFKDKERAEQIARDNEILLADGPKVLGLLAFAAATRTGVVVAENLKAWHSQVIDIAASETEPDDTADPTSALLEAPSMP